MRTFAISTLFSVITYCGLAQSTELHGIVRAQEGRHEALSFVSVLVKGKKSGVLADLDGMWKVSAQQNDTLLFNYVGYEPRQVPVRNLLNNQDNIIFLKEKDFTLETVVITPVENPAHRIIRQVLENKKKNDWENIPAFSYTTYNRFTVQPERKDSDDREASKSTSVIFESDKSLDSLFEKQYLFLTESVVETKYKAPGKRSENMVAYKVSGFKDPLFSVFATQYNHFNVYDELIEVGDKQYLSPIAKGCIRKYLYLLKDTLWSAEGDTVFVIAYRPRHNTHFDGFRGLLYISSKQYAVQNVIARPVSTAEGLNLKIQQEFKWIDNVHWFPVNINSDLMFGNLNRGGKGQVAATSGDKKQYDEVMAGVGKSYIQHINFGPELKRKDFGSLAFVVDKDAGNRDSSFWNIYRKQPLGTKEKQTYRVIDSVGKAQKLDLKMKFFEAFFDNRVRIGPFDLPVDKLFAYNQYEGTRLGLGLYNNDKISPYFSLGGYGGYGFKDKGIKYGASLDLMPVPRSLFRFGVLYKKDVVEFGGIELPLDRRPSPMEFYHDFYVNNMTTDEVKSGWIRWKMLKYLQTQVSLSQTYTQVNNTYSYMRNDLPSKQFQFTEGNAGFRYAFREKFIRILDRNYPIATGYPIVWLSLTHGFNNLLNGEFSYDKLDLKLEKSITIKLAGVSDFQFRAGRIWGKTPLFKDYSARANEPIGFPIASKYVFETMRMNEFFSSQYATFHYTHSFGSLLFKYKKFNPTLRLYQNMGWGAMENKTLHQGMNFKTMVKGYYESGVSIDGILKNVFSKVGVGGFYRYGPYSFPEFKNNLAVKLTYIVGF